jgi:hypothetical protein
MNDGHVNGVKLRDEVDVSKEVLFWYIFACFLSIWIKDLNYGKKC